MGKFLTVTFAGPFWACVIIAFLHVFGWAFVSFIAGELKPFKVDWYGVRFFVAHLTVFLWLALPLITDEQEGS